MTDKMREFKERCRLNAKAEKDLYRITYGFIEDQDKIDACLKFFQKLADALNESYIVYGSCNQDISQYLVPKGTENDISYYGKPVKSFRISDHWNWYSNLKKCKNPDYVQCESTDIPPAAPRKDSYHASNPQYGLQVAIQLDDGKYHHVFGDKWNALKNCFDWIENDPADIVRRYELA